MSEAQWQHWVAPSGDFELDLPPAVELQRQERPGRGREYPSRDYWFCSPVPEMGTFSILCEQAPGKSAQALIELERKLNATVTIEVNEAIARQDHSVHHLRFRTMQMRPREWIEDPGTGRIHDVPAHKIEELADYTFWTTGNRAIRVGYRIHQDASAELKAIFVEMLESFRVLEAAK